MRSMNQFRNDRQSVRIYQVVLVVAGIATLIGVGLNAMWDIRLMAERTHVAWMVATLKSAMGNEVGVRAVRGGSHAIAELDRSNPMQWLATPPVGYQGEVESLATVQPSPQSWYFERQSQQLIYTIANKEAFYFPLGELERLRFMVLVRYSAGHQGDPNSVIGIDLLALDAYSVTVDSVVKLHE